MYRVIGLDGVQFDIQTSEHNTCTQYEKEICLQPLDDTDNIMSTVLVTPAYWYHVHWHGAGVISFTISHISDGSINSILPIEGAVQNWEVKINLPGRQGAFMRPRARTGIIGPSGWSGHGVPVPKHFKEIVQYNCTPRYNKFTDYKIIRMTDSTPQKGDYIRVGLKYNMVHFGRGVFYVYRDPQDQTKDVNAHPLINRVTTIAIEHNGRNVIFGTEDTTRSTRYREGEVIRVRALIAEGVYWLSIDGATNE